MRQSIHFIQLTEAGGAFSHLQRVNGGKQSMKLSKTMLTFDHFTKLLQGLDDLQDYKSWHLFNMNNITMPAIGIVVCNTLNLLVWKSLHKYAIPNNLKENPLYGRH